MLELGSTQRVIASPTSGSRSSHGRITWPSRFTPLRLKSETPIPHQTHATQCVSNMKMPPNTTRRTNRPSLPISSACTVHNLPHLRRRLTRRQCATNDWMPPSGTPAANISTGNGRRWSTRVSLQSHHERGSKEGGRGVEGRCSRGGRAVWSAHGVLARRSREKSLRR